jgi:putative membrane protein
MNRRLDTLLKAVVLLASGLMLYAKIGDGTLAFYINQRFAWLSLAAVLIFFTLAAALAYRVLPVRRAAPSAGLHDHDHAHNHGAHRASWLAIGLLALPALLGFFTPARPLGAGAIESRGIGLLAPDRPGSETQVRRLASGPKNILDWLREFSRNSDPGAFTGRQADVIGFVYRDPRSRPDEFWVSRFAISCCVADASALGLLVKADQSPGLKTDSWVRVVGTFKAGEFGGERIPMIVAESIEPVEQPSQPYLYP